MIAYFAKKLFGTRNDRVVKSLEPVVVRINELEGALQGLSDDELRAKTAEFRSRIERGEALDSILPEAFAVVREASRRVLNMRHFDVQLVGGIVLHKGMIAEMKTGEGKTLVATLPSYLNALTGKGVHVVTVNDYLAKRDSEWMGRLFAFLGLRTGVVLPGQRDTQKREAYLADITYGQNNEFGFDYLRDNMKFSASDMFQRGHNFAIVDEVDSILIDEARTPLIISGPAEESTDLYFKINQIIPRLQSNSDFEIELRTKQPALTEAGVARCEELLGIENLYDPNNIEVLHHVQQALKAHSTMERDVDYVVKEGQIIIVDEFTGRLMPGRRWSDGLHQAIEAKEGLKVARENQTLASITFQNYFRMYGKLAGMTGTADTESVEFKTIYNLEVICIPSNRKMVRIDESDQVFRTKAEKYAAVVEDIAKAHTTGQPILVGTISIEQSEALSRELQKKAVPHNVLNAKQHEREAEIIAQAGRLNAVTISTNMAGRGTDILLGGNPDFLAAAEAGTRDRDDPAYQTALEKYTKQCAEEREKVRAVGGLFIMGTERHESRRIDNQLRGRAGRQGDPGKSRFSISLEDDLMKRFGGERMQALMTKLGWEEGVAIDGRMISGSIESAQKRVEGFHFDSRKHVTEYDDVMNKQRQVIYNLRSRILNHQGVRDEILTMVDDLLEDAVLAVCDEKKKSITWDLQALAGRFQFLFNVPFTFPSDLHLEHQSVFDALRSEARRIYSERIETLDAKLLELREIFTKLVHADDGSELRNPFDFSTEEIEQDTILSVVDHLWKIHLQEMDHLREGIGLRGYGQKNPLHEYQKEGFLLFQQVIHNLKEGVVRQLYYYQLPEPREYVERLEAERRRREEFKQQIQMTHPQEEEADPASEGAAARSDDQRARMLALRKARRKAKK